MFVKPTNDEIRHALLSARTYKEPECLTVLEIAALAWAAESWLMLVDMVPKPPKRPPYYFWLGSEDHLYV